LPYCNVDPSTVTAVNKLNEGALVFGHAPSHRGIKGTEQILSAISNLRGLGFNCELRLFEGIPNEIARRGYEEVDIMIDQLHIGWYGGLAVEVMALAKPVAVFIRDEDVQLVPNLLVGDLPFLRISSTTLEQDLISILGSDRAELRKIGLKSRAYVENWHSPESIARNLTDVLRLSDPVQ
jgi:hypothetical protein